MSIPPSFNYHAVVQVSHRANSARRMLDRSSPHTLGNPRLVDPESNIPDRLGKLIDTISPSLRAGVIILLVPAWPGVGDLKGDFIVCVCGDDEFFHGGARALALGSLRRSVAMVFLFIGRDFQCRFRLLLNRPRFPLLSVSQRLHALCFRRSWRSNLESLGR